MTNDRPQGTNWGAQILALGEDLHRLRGQLTDLAGIGDQVTGLVDDVAVLHNQVQQLLDDAGDKPVRVWDWTRMNREEAAAAWHTLLDWVRDVLTGTYGLVGHTGGRQRKLPPCWYRHPDAVAELSWLCQEWHRVYRSSKGTPAAAGEWHDRWLPGTVNRLLGESTLGNCDRDGNHVEPKQGQSIDDASALAAVIEADMAQRTDAPVPGQPQPVG